MECADMMKKSEWTPRDLKESLKYYKLAKNANVHDAEHFNWILYINQIESIDSKNDIFIPKTEITRPEPKKDERDFSWGVMFYWFHEFNQNFK